MRCQKASKQLQLYLDNRLTIDQTRALEAHVANCAACLEELALLEEITQNLHHIKVVIEPDDLNEQIIDRKSVV